MPSNQLEECFTVKVKLANFVDHKYGYVFIELIHQYLEFFDRLRFFDLLLLRFLSFLEMTMSEVSLMDCFRIWN